MEIRLNKKDFVKSLQIGGSFARKSKVLPILECVKLKGKGNTGFIISTDNENAISKMFSFESDGIDFSFCVNYKDLLSYVKLIKDDTFTIEYNPSESTQIVISHTKGSTELPVQDATVFPQLKKGGEEKEFTVDAALLNNWIVDGSKFVANDELRPVMNGIFFYFEKGKFGFCASDGTVLCTDSIDYEYDGEEQVHFILNKTAFSPLCDSMSNSTEVKVKIGENITTFINNDIVLMSRCIEGRYPNFRSVIPTTNNIECKAEKNSLIDAISRCKLSSSNTSLLKCNFNTSSIKIESQDIDFAKKSSETVDCTSNGEITIGLNAEKLINCVSCINTDNVVVKLSDSSRAILLLDDDSENNRVIIQMPMMLND